MRLPIFIPSDANISCKPSSVASNDRLPTYTLLDGSTARGTLSYDRLWTESLAESYALFTLWAAELAYELAVSAAELAYELAVSATELAVSDTESMADWTVEVSCWSADDGVLCSDFASTSASDFPSTSASGA